MKSSNLDVIMRFLAAEEPGESLRHELGMTEDDFNEQRNYIVSCGLARWDIDRKRFVLTVPGEILSSLYRQLSDGATDEIRTAGHPHLVRLVHQIEDNCMLEEFELARVEKQARDLQMLQIIDAALARQEVTKHALRLEALKEILDYLAKLPR